MANLKNTTIQNGVLGLPDTGHAGRPTGTQGSFRYNSESKRNEFYNGSTWVGTDNGEGYVTDGLSVYLDAGKPESVSEPDLMWKDLSGNENHCIWNTAPAYNANGWFTWTGTQSGDIANVSGTAGRLGSLDFSYEQTLMVWMYHTDAYSSGRRNIWDQSYGGYGTWTHEQGNNISQYYGDNGPNGSPYIGFGSTTTPRDVWNCMCHARSTTESEWYRQGSSTNTRTNPYAQITNTTPRIRIGQGYAGTWIGDMAIVMCYNRRLTDAEIEQNFEAFRTRFGV